MVCISTPKSFAQGQFNFFAYWLLLIVFFFGQFITQFYPFFFRRIHDIKIILDILLVKHPSHSDGSWWKLLVITCQPYINVTMIPKSKCILNGVLFKSEPFKSKFWILCELATQPDLRRKKTLDNYTLIVIVTDILCTHTIFISRIISVQSQQKRTILSQIYV